MAGETGNASAALSSQCMMPSTFEAVPLIRSNFLARAGSAPGLNAAYLSLVRSRTMATA
jgi:hypothetical protein